MGKKVYDLVVEGEREKGNQNRVWMNRVKEALKNRGWTLEQVGKIVYDRPEWGGLGNGV